ncbi:MAG: sulfatase-like hydrolase/transferase [Myxococcota bacterium]|nr:sulfatase-like hydrolase/transferase [Myxococcota bacterium]
MTFRRRVWYDETAQRTVADHRRMEELMVDAAAVIAAWIGLLLTENIAMWFLWREHFSGAWEIALARHTVVPIAIVVVSPLSIVIVIAWNAATRAANGERAPAFALAVSGAIAMGAVAMGVSGGRHFASWTVRMSFVVASAIAGALGGAHLPARVTALERHPLRLAAVGLAIAISAWLADDYLLSRLYPGFHAAMLASTLVGSALIGISFRAGHTPTRWARWMAGLVAIAVGSCAAWTMHATRLLDRATNLRVALVEHAPLLGRAVMLIVALRPPRADEAPPTRAASETITPGEVARALDWTGHDLILLSVDALRADHVSSYGYRRTTTPNIDELAREGTLFESAYCPTPHTSYSVTSMLTGKYLRPLMVMGLGAEDSETWPQALRRYGWRTAAFYPPAVFFIDQDRFAHFAEEHLGFEYAKVEFADATLREQQVTDYLDRIIPEVPLFLWVHFFEPHEPYETHPDHIFPASGAPDVDAYDSEIAAADDGIGRLLRLIRRRRPGAVFVVTADHGEEFGEHGGHYHGTTVYEEQVRVPLVVAGPGVRRGGRVGTVVQTIDLLPTALSALGIPRPPRIRGRDLGSLLAGGPNEADLGFAFAETDDYALIASGDDRLVCERRAAACAIYRPRDDPEERRDVANAQAQRFAGLNAMLREVERDHGRYEASGSAPWPEALRRALQGEADAALDVASLLDDADVAIRRKAAEICFTLRVPATIPAVKRALIRDEDDEVRRWTALALTRMGQPLAPLVDAMLKDPSREWRARAALVIAERGEPRACEEIAASWDIALPRAGEGIADGQPPRLTLDLDHAAELLAAMGRARCKNAVPALAQALADVRARPYVADALGAIGDDRARAPLLAFLADEKYVTARPHEARALLALGARDWSSSAPVRDVQTTLSAPAHAYSLRLLVLLSDASASLDAHADGLLLPASPLGTEVRAMDFPPVLAKQVRNGDRRVDLRLEASSGGVIALWLVRAERLD